MRYTEEQINQTLNFLKQNIDNTKPKVALILGSGLGETPINLENLKKIPYTEIPNFPVSTVKGHSGNLLIGKFGKMDCIIMQGRFHHYEGYSPEELFFPIRVLSKIGIRNLIVTNAAGGISPDFQPGDFMLILDHINLMGGNPLVGINPSWLKSRFVDMSQAYDPQLIKLAETVGIELKIPMKRGVYAAMSGPSYETPSEVRMLRTMGADAVGMSTVPEVIVANSLGMKTLGISYISNLASGYTTKSLSHSEVLDTAEKIKSAMSKLIEGILSVMEKKIDEKENKQPNSN